MLSYLFVLTFDHSVFLFDTALHYDTAESVG